VPLVPHLLLSAHLAMQHRVVSVLPHLDVSGIPVLLPAVHVGLLKSHLAFVTLPNALCLAVPAWAAMLV